MFTPSNGPEMSSFISAAPVASGQVQSLDSLRGHSLPTDAMIMASATQVNPTNQNTGSYAIVESSGTATSVVYGGSIPATTSSPFADLYKEGSMYFSGVSTSNISATTGTYGPGTGGFTAEAWVNFQTFTGASTGYNNGGTVFQQAPSLMGSYQPSTGGTNGWSFGPTIYGQICFYYIGSSSAQTANTTTAISLNTWNHIAVSIPNGGPISLYINGVQTTSQGNNGGVLGATGSTVALVGTPNSYSPFGAGSYYGQAITAYVADIRVVSGAVVYTGSSFTVPSAPLSPYTSGTTQILIRAGQNSPTVQNGALTFDRGLKQYMNFGPQTFNIVTQGFTAVWRGQFTGTAGNYETIFEGGLYGTNNGGILISRAGTSTGLYFQASASTGTSAVFTVGAPSVITQGTQTVIAARYNPVTSLADIWINGVFQASATCSPATLVGDRIVSGSYIGYPYATYSFTSMTSNTLAIYNRALSNAEILTATQALNTVPATPQQKTLEIGDINGTPALSVAGNGQVSVQSIGLSSNVVPWPPAAMTSYDTVINGGVYKARASNELSSSYVAWFAFDKTVNLSNEWVSPIAYNTSSPYNYTGTVTTTDVNGTVYSGEWLQIQVPSSILLANYTIAPSPGSASTQGPQKFNVLGSRDGVNWTLVDSRSGITNWTNGVTQTFSLSSSPSQAFSYYRIVTTILNGGQVVAIAEWTLYGTADASPSLTIAPATTFVTSVTTPSLSGIASNSLAPQDFSSSGLNIPAYVVSNTATVANTVAYSSFGPFAGEGSLYFPGGTGAYVSFPSSVPSLNYDIFTSDFTIEGWAYNAGRDGNQNTILNRTTVGNYGDWGIFQQGVSIYFMINQAVTYINQGSGADAPANQWYHFAVTMASNTIRIFVNGVTGNPSGNAKPTTSYTSTGAVNVGWWTFVSTGKFVGNITNLRIVRGLALYTATFTPPTQSLQPIQGTTQAGLPYGTVLLLRNAPAPGRIQTTRLTGSNSVGLGGAPQVLSFPPAAMTGYSTALNAGYGQGTYVASASAEFSGTSAWNAFDRNTGTNWGGQSGQYSGSGSAPYLYVGGSPPRTVDVNGNSYTGDWVQIQMPSSIVLASYSIYYNTAYGCPALFYLLGSRDGINWTLVDQRNQAQPGSSGYITFSVSSSQSFTYFRLQAFGLTTSGGTVNVLEWTLNGSIEGLNINPDGKVGLGVVNPTRALEVAGDVVCGGTLSAGNPLMFRNALYNGDFRIAQRGTSFTNPSTQYTLDRWYISAYGAVGNGTVSQIQSGLANFSNAFQWATTSTTAGNWYISQSLETRDVVRFQGQPVTVSFWYRIPTNFTQTWSPALFWTTSVDTAITNAVSGSPNTAGFGNMPNTTAWTYTQFQAFVPSTAQALSVMFTTYNNTVNGATLQITGVQLEKGSVATPYEILPYATELALCQRYYQELPFGGSHFTGNGRCVLSVAGTNSSMCGTGIYFQVPMRANPAPTYYGAGTAPGNFTVYAGSSGTQTAFVQSSSNVATAQISTTMMATNIVTTAVTASGGSSVWYDMGWTGTYLGITLNAEL